MKDRPTTGTFRLLSDGRAAFIPDRETEPPPSDPPPVPAGGRVCLDHSGLCTKVADLRADTKRAELQLDELVRGHDDHERRIRDLEAIARPWRNLLLNVGTAAALAALAYAKAKGWF